MGVAWAGRRISWRARACPRDWTPRCIKATTNSMDEKGWALCGGGGDGPPLHPKGIISPTAASLRGQRPLPNERSGQANPLRAIPKGPPSLRVGSFLVGWGGGGGGMRAVVSGRLGRDRGRRRVEKEIRSSAAATTHCRRAAQVKHLPAVLPQPAGGTAGTV